MNIIKSFQTKNDCYRPNKKHTVKGIMVHSTGANNPKLSRYVQPDDGILGDNPYNNDWNRSGITKCVHAFIGKDKNGNVRTYQTLPWDMPGWHSGSGFKGSSYNANNTGYIGFEICEDGLTDRTYFNQVYKEAVNLCVYLCKMYDLSVNTIIGHYEGNKLGIASNHGDPKVWFSKHGKSMDTLRRDAEELLINKGADSMSSELQQPMKLNAREWSDIEKTYSMYRSNGILSSDMWQKLAADKKLTYAQNIYLTTTCQGRFIEQFIKNNK